MIKTYIFAGGENTRWKEDYPKEMAVVQDNEPVLIRTIRQCYELKLKPIVVTHKPEILSYDSDYIRYTHFITDRFPTLAHACKAVDWSDWCLFLLGDVWYSDYAWQTIRSIKDKLAFGNEVEIFAFRFAENWHTKLNIAIDEAIKYWEDGKGRGKLWETYRAFEGYNFYEQRLGERFALIEDETTDFDTVEEYMAFPYREKEE